MRLAHRGDHRRAVENTIPAFLTAMARPACDGLEFDVRQSRDGAPVLLHDTTLARVQGRPDAVVELTVAELDAIGVPTLASVLAAVPRRAFLDIELKEVLGRPLLEVLAGGRGPDLANAVISSFDPLALRRMRGLASAWPLWLNAVDLAVPTIELALELDCAGIAAEYHGIDERGVDRARQAGLEVAGWTVTRRPTYARMVELGVVAVCVEGPALDG
ncbi:MAG TPA: glycerophosphodiester phosphodiesterase [Candidatus Limnocylindrales bacterium]